jgi:hypothetical protein
MSFGQYRRVNSWKKERAYARCVKCGQGFVLSSEGQSAMYWHLRREHDLSHDEAFDAVSQSAID